MRKKTFFLVVIFMLVVFAFFYVFRPSESPERTARTFTSNLFKAAPPSLDRSAIKGIVDSLSEKAKEGIKNLTDIAYFAQVQDLPDRGYEVVSIYTNKDRAMVKMKWIYSEKPVLKDFYMVFENGKWKIDRIRTSKI